MAVERSSNRSRIVAVAFAYVQDNSALRTDLHDIIRIDRPWDKYEMVIFFEYDIRCYRPPSKRQPGAVLRGGLMAGPFKIFPLFLPNEVQQADILTEV